MVVFFVVADQIAQRKTIVCGDEIDAGGRMAAAVVENIRRPRQTFGKRAQIAAFPHPKRAHIIAETSVPLGKRLREIAQVIAAFADVPRLDNQFAACQHGVLVHHLKKASVSLKIGFPPQYRSQVEAETVHMKCFRPIAQAVRRPTGYVAANNVQRIAAARPVFIAAVGLQPIPQSIVYAALAKHRAFFILLGGMVVHDIQYHFQARLVQGFDRLLQLFRRAFGIGGIRRLDGKMGIGVVAPIIAQAHFLQMVFVQMLVYRQQLDGGNAQSFQIINHARIGQRLIRSRVFQIGELLGKPFHMGFIHYRPAPRMVRTALVAPIKIIVAHYHAFGCHRRIVPPVFRTKPCHFLIIPITRFAVDFFGIRVNQQFIRIETRAARRISTPVNTKTIPLPCPDLRHKAVKHRPAPRRHFQPSFPSLVKEAQLDFFGMNGKQRKIRPFLSQRHAHRIRRTFFNAPCFGFHFVCPDLMETRRAALPDSCSFYSGLTLNQYGVASP